MADKQELILDLLSRDKTAAATGSAARNIEKVGTAADAAGKKSAKLTTAAAAATERTEDLGEGAQDASAKIQHLDREIGKLNQDLVLMAGAMATAEDKASRLDIAKGIRKAQSEIRQLEGSKKILGGLLPEPAQIVAQAVSVGQKTGDGILSGLISKLSKAGPLVPLLAGAALAMAPVIGGTIAAAVIGGAGVGGIVGGVMLAARNQQVAKEGTRLGNTIFDQAATSAEKYFVAPTLASIKLVGRAWTGMQKDVDRLFANTGKLLPHLVSGATLMLSRVTQGIADLSEGAQPVVETLSRGMAEIGDAVGDVFTDLKDNGVDAAIALKLALGAVEGTIRIVGGAVNALTESFGFLARIGAFGKEAQQEYVRLTANAKIAAEANKQSAEALGGVRSAGSAAAGAISALVKSMGDLNEENRTLYGATTSTAEAIRNATKAAKDNGRTLSLNTKAGLDNRRALEGIATAAAAQLEAYIAVNGEGAGSTRIANQNRAAFIRVATSMTGSAAKARALANDLLGIPNVSPKVTVRGVSAAKAAARTISATLNAIRDETVNINYQVNGTNSSALRAAFRKNANAAGGPMQPREPYLVGEHGPEIVESDVPARVLSASASRGKLAMARAAGRMLSPAGGSSPFLARNSQAGSNMPTTLRLETSSRADSRVAELINYLIRNGDIRVEAVA